MSAYPDLPCEPRPSATSWPNSVTDFRSSHGDVFGSCPHCRAEYIAYCIGGEPFHKVLVNSSVWRRNDHIEYTCGGVWQDMGNGYWSGKCWARKTNQLSLALIAEEE